MYIDCSKSFNLSRKHNRGRLFLDILDIGIMLLSAEKRTLTIGGCK